MQDISWRENEKIKDISQNVHTNIFCSWNNNYISSFISFFIFPKTYLETRKEKIYNIANEISSNMNGKEINIQNKLWNFILRVVK